MSNTGLGTSPCGLKIEGESGLKIERESGLKIKRDWFKDPARPPTVKADYTGWMTAL